MPAKPSSFNNIISFARLGIEFETVLKNHESKNLASEICDVFESDETYRSIYSKMRNLNDERHYLVSAAGAAAEIFTQKIMIDRFKPIYSKFGISLNKLFELFEIFNNYGQIVWGLHEERYPGKFWRIENDNTIRGNGVEIVSPKLAPHDFLKTVPAAAVKIIESGLSGSSRCGYHVHISFPFMKFASCRQIAAEIYIKITGMGFSYLAALIYLTCNNIKNITQFGDIKRMVCCKSTRTVLSVIKKTLDGLIETASSNNLFDNISIKSDDLIYNCGADTDNVFIENLKHELLKYKKRFLSGGRNTIIRLFDDNVELRHLGGENALSCLAGEKTIYEYLENAVSAIPYFLTDEFILTEKDVYQTVKNFIDTEISILLKTYGIKIC